MVINSWILNSRKQYLRTHPKTAVKKKASIFSNNTQKSKIKHQQGRLVRDQVLFSRRGSSPYIYIYIYIYTQELCEARGVSSRLSRHTYIHTYIHILVYNPSLAHSVLSAGGVSRRLSRHTYIHTYIHILVYNSSLAPSVLSRGAVAVAGLCVCVCVCVCGGLQTYYL